MTALRAIILALLVVAAWLCVSLWATGERLRLQTPGRFATAPADWWVRIWLTPEDEDRVLTIIADGPMFRSSDITLTGLRSAKVYQYWFHALSAGCYEFIAVVRQQNGDGPIVAQAVAPWPLSVSGPGTAGDVCGGSPP